MYCSNCGSPLEKGASFCVNCGTRVSQSDDNICVICGAKIEDKDKFCSGCGRKLLFQKK